MNGYSADWLINSIPSTHPSLESTTYVLSDNTSDGGQETERDTRTKTPTSKKSPVVLPGCLFVCHLPGCLFVCHLPGCLFVCHLILLLMCFLFII